MSFKRALINLGKLLLCGLTFSAGIIVGSMAASLLRLPTPTTPAGMDTTVAMRDMLLESPILAFALALIAQGLGGGFLTRAAFLSFLTWIAYTVNTHLEASIFTTMAGGFWFSIVAFSVPCLFCGAAVAFLFPPRREAKSLVSAAREFFARRTSTAWVWRLAVAAVAFMPIYWFFGMLVVPFTGEYYRQNMYGLAMPSLDQLLAILFIRSVLFLLACLPIVVLWQESEHSLFFRLGFALFVLVGLLLMLAEWMPLSVRLPHTIEILADEFVYAGAVVALLTKGGEAALPEQRVVGHGVTG